MRASLNFSLPQDAGEFNAALSGRESLSVLRKIDRLCSSACQYEGDAVELASEIRRMIPDKLLAAERGR